MFLTAPQISELTGWTFGRGKGANLIYRQIAVWLVLAIYVFGWWSDLEQVLSGDFMFFVDSMWVFIEKSKTDQFRDGEWVPVARCADLSLCHVAVLTSWLEFTRRSGMEPLFGIVAPYGARGPHIRPGTVLLYTCCLEVVKIVCKELGVSNGMIGTHIARVSGASLAAEALVSDRLFQKHGRWKSAGIKNSYVKESIKAKLSVTDAMISAIQQP